MKHIMAVDGRWWFVFSITIENRSLALWYANCSIFVSSKPLNIKKILEIFFIHICVADDYRLRQAS
jgi:hypothetical protein